MRDLRVTVRRWGGLEVLVASYPVGASVGHTALSAAEQEVARLLVDGLSNRDIAARRGTSSRTVANQVASMLRKLGVTSRNELVARLLAPLR
jgi:DNA-binding CsgD family transcriptional regulator